MDLVLSRELPDLLPDAVRRCAGRPEGVWSEVGRAVCLNDSAGGMVRYVTTVGPAPAWPGEEGPRCR